MKKLWIWLVAAGIFLNSCGSTTVPISVEHSFVWKITKDESILYIEKEEDRVYPASLTKLLTALYALSFMDPQTLITPGEEVYLPPEGSSSAYIRPQHTLTLEMLIEGMLLPSGNDAAYAVAAAGGRVIADNDGLPPEEAVTIFVNNMNRYAEELGCTDTHFTTPDGFAGEEHYSSTADMAVIAKAASENEQIMQYAGLHSDDVTYASGHTNTWINTNAFLDPSSAYYNKNIVGLKTGSLTDNYCLLTVYDDGETRFIFGVFGCPDENARYEDTEMLMEMFLEK